MSKHEKHVRRERRKTDQARRQRASFRHPTSAIRHGGAAALAAAAVIAAGTQAYADPVRFDNPAHAEAGHFHWVDAGIAERPWAGHGALDVAALPGGQPGSYYSLSTVDQQTNYPGLGYLNVTNGGTYEGGVQGNGSYVVGLDSGTLIPTAGLSFAQRLNSYSPYATYTPEGVPTYIGLRFGDPWCGYYGTANYGWIGVVRTGRELEAFAWGYETEPGVAIPAGIPEPGTLALLAFGAAAIGRRRRA